MPVTAEIHRSKLGFLVSELAVIDVAESNEEGDDVEEIVRI